MFERYVRIDESFQFFKELICFGVGHSSRKHRVIFTGAYQFVSDPACEPHCGSRYTGTYTETRHAQFLQARNGRGARSYEDV